MTLEAISTTTRVKTIEAIANRILFPGVPFMDEFFLTVPAHSRVERAPSRGRRKLNPRARVGLSMRMRNCWHVVNSSQIRTA